MAVQKGLASISRDVQAKTLPYYQLMRLDKPQGTLASLFPDFIGLLFATAASSTSNKLSVSLARTAALLVVHNTLLRSAACTWNDLIDADLDRKVTRCKHRPIARGAVSERQALLFLAAQLIVLVAFSHFAELLNQGALSFAVLETVLLTAYPFAKRVTHYPQVVLGFALAFGTLKAGMLAASSQALDVRAACCLFGAMVVWPCIYDSIYAHQDVKDDVKIGVKSMAVRFRESTKALCVMLSSVMVGLLAGAGWIQGFGISYLLYSCGGAAAALGAMIRLVDLTKPRDCMEWFVRQFYLVGGAMVGGLLLECGNFQVLQQ
jgi:4-hydroxybenzoate polyprenyltransferase